MAIMKATEVQVQRLIAARGQYNRKSLKKAVMNEIHSMHSIPKSRKIKIVTGPKTSPNYLVIRDKRTGQPLMNELADPVMTVAAKPVEAPVAAKKATKPAAKKVAPAKVAAAKAPAKPAAKKATPAKAPTKAAAKPAVKAAEVSVKPTKAASSPKPLGSAVKTAKYTIEVRVTNPKTKVRQRIGFASSEAMKQKMVAQFKNAL